MRWGRSHIKWEGLEEMDLEMNEIKENILVVSDENRKPEYSISQFAGTIKSQKNKKKIALYDKLRNLASSHEIMFLADLDTENTWKFDPCFMIKDKDETQIQVEKMLVKLREDYPDTKFLLKNSNYLVYYTDLKFYDGLNEQKVIERLGIPQKRESFTIVSDIIGEF